VKDFVADRLLYIFFEKAIIFYLYSSKLSTVHAKNEMQMHENPTIIQYYHTFFLKQGTHSLKCLSSMQVYVDS